MNKCLKSIYLLIISNMDVNVIYKKETSVDEKTGEKSIIYVKFNKRLQKWEIITVFEKSGLAVHHDIKTEEYTNLQAITGEESNEDEFDDAREKTGEHHSDSIITS